MTGSPDSREDINLQEETPSRASHQEISVFSHSLIPPKKLIPKSSKSLEIDYKPKSFDDYKKDQVNPERKYDIRSKVLSSTISKNPPMKMLNSKILEESIQGNENENKSQIIMGMEPYNFSEDIDTFRKWTNEKVKKALPLQKIETNEEFNKGEKNLDEASNSLGYHENWEDLFYKTLKENYGESRLDYKKTLANELIMVEILLEFQGFAQNIIKNIVKELLLPPHRRQYTPITDKKDVLIFNLSKEGILIKMTGLGFDNVEGMSEKWKNLGNEYRSNMYTLSKLIENMKKNPKQTYYKVPLSCLVDYLGFRGLIYCKSNWVSGDKTLVLGYDSNDKFQRNTFLNENIILNLGNIFNIRVWINLMNILLVCIRNILRYLYHLAKIPKS